VVNRIERLIEKAELHYMSVKEYQQLSSDLARLARNTDDPAMERAMYKMRDALDFEFQKAFPDESVELKEARKHWRNLRDLEQSKALDGGDFRPVVMYNYLRNRYGRVVPEAEGGGEFNDIATTAKTFRNKTPNSGTPTAQALSDFAGASPMGKAFLLGGNAASRAYMSPLMNWMFRETSLPTAGGRVSLASMADMLARRSGRSYGAGLAEEEGL
jgi:hypothetical protein